VRRTSDVPEAAAVRQLASAALVIKGVPLAQLGRFEEAITVTNEVVSRVGAAAEAALREQVAKALRIDIG
jgi:hypothetical protein